jgi:cytochrome c553
MHVRKSLTGKSLDGKSLNGRSLGEKSLDGRSYDGRTRAGGFYSGRSTTALLSWLVIVLAGAGVLPAQAQDSIEDKAAVCGSCHGEKGVPIDKLIPVIWGQYQGYLYLQLRDFKLANRKSDQMQPIVQDMSRDDMMALAEYFSQKTWPNLNQPRATDAQSKTAEAAIVSGQCGACHGEQGLGSGTQPRIAGQGVDYLQRTLTEFRTRQRSNNPWMSDIMNTLKPEDIEALSAYMAGR